MVTLQTEETKVGKKIYPRRCPICNVDTNYVYLIHETETKKEAMWFHCACGIIFQENYPAHKSYNENYIASYIDGKEFDIRSTHAVRTYINLIEELTYGRMMLDVGFNAPSVMNYYKDRGWITWGIDINPSITGEGNIYQGDFMTYDFQPHTKDPKIQEFIKEKEIHRTFDLIWISHTFEHFNNPVGAIDKIYNLLSPDGVVFISTPDIDFINKTGVRDYPHWRKDEHYVMWNETALNREFERRGFKRIMSRRNFSSRYISWYDLHCIYQKRFF